jgi:hypothetical protein
MNARFASPITTTVAIIDTGLFAAELLIPRQALKEAFTRLFGSSVEADRIDEGQAFSLMSEKMTATEMMRLTPNRAREIGR